MPREALRLLCLRPKQRLLMNRKGRHARLKLLPPGVPSQRTTRTKIVRNPDYLAEKFIRPGFLETIGFGSDFELSRKWLKMKGIFTDYYVNARTHHIDTILKKVASEGVKQVVILGAGYDSRAYHFRKIFPDLKFFEVDLPATQAQKKERLTEIFGSVPDWVAYAPIFSIPSVLRMS